MLVGPAGTRGTPPTWPYPAARIVGESAPFAAPAGARDLVLSELRLVQAGDTLGPLAGDGPTGLAVLEGRVRFGADTLGPDAVGLQLPGDQRALVNAGPGPARLLALSVASAGGPVQLPRTGDPGLIIVLGAAAIGLIGGAVARRRTPRPAAAERRNG